MKLSFLLENYREIYSITFSCKCKRFGIYTGR